MHALYYIFIKFASQNMKNLSKKIGRKRYKFIENPNFGIGLCNFKFNIEIKQFKVK